MFFPCFVIENKPHPCCCDLNMTEDINETIAYWRFYLPVIHSCVIYDINFMYRYCSLQPSPIVNPSKFYIDLCITERSTYTIAYRKEFNVIIIFRVEYLGTAMVSRCCP